MATEAAKSAGASAELTGEAPKARDAGAKAASGAAKAATATVLEALLKAGLVGILSPTGLLHACLEACLVSILAGLKSTILA